MSWQAMEAVQDHSSLNKQEEYSGLLIMLAIARFCNADGVAGWGGKRTSPTTETIAEKAHVTKRTVLNWLPKLEAAGELIVVRHGKGRGSWNHYTINLPMPVNGEQNGESQSSPKQNNGEANGEQNGESQSSPLTVEELALMVNQMQEMVNVMVKNGEPQSSPDTEIDPETDTEKAVAATALTVYQNNIGTLAPKLTEKITAYVIEFGEQWVIDAIMEAKERGVYRWNYAQTILDRWRVEGRGSKPPQNGRSHPEIKPNAEGVW